MENKELADAIEKMGKDYADFQAVHAQMKKDFATQDGRVDGVLKEHYDKVTKAVADQHAEITKHYNELAAKLERMTVTEPNTDEAKSFAKEAHQWKRTGMMRRKQINRFQELPADPVEEYKAYSQAFQEYCHSINDPSPETMKALAAGTAEDGGFFIRPVWSDRISTKIFESSPIRSLATVESVSGPELKFPVDIGEADYGWVGEQTARNVTNTPQIQEKSILAHEMYALPKATQTILEDAGIDVEAWLMNKVAEKFARAEATAFVNGNGVAKPRGLLSYPSGTDWGQVERVVSGAAATFTAQGLLNIVASLKEPYQAGARWLIRRESIATLMGLEDTEGHFIFAPIFSSGYNNQALIGYPITYAADMPGVGAGNEAAIFGNIKTAYTIVDRIGIQTLRDPFSYKPFVGFYTRRRVGGDVLNFEAYKIQKLAVS